MKTEIEVPVEIAEAAEKVRVWAESQGWQRWEIGGVCDRRFAFDYHSRKISVLDAMERQEKLWDRFMRMS